MKTETNVLLKLYKGQYPLSIAFWLFGLGGKIAWTIIITLGSSCIYHSHGYSLTLVMARTLFLLMVSYWIIALIGIWKSATNYLDNALYATAAKVAVAFGWLELVKTLDSISKMI